jgi:RNAse (barnase) inhibitor barstar
MYYIDKQLRQHYNEDRDSFMVRMITNVDKQINITFDHLDQTHHENQNIAEKMFKIMKYQQNALEDEID